MEVSKELLPDQSPGLLKELHLLTPNGDLNADARRKLKQVNHLFQFLWPALQDLAERHQNLTLVDIGAGKAYLGFIMYELFMKNLSQGEILSIEQRPELIKSGTAVANRLGYNRMRFLQGTLENTELPPRVHLLTALHACDTLTDEALIVGIRNKADYIAVVPCCQAETARLLKAEQDSPLRELWEHPIHRREFGSHLTNVLRALVLEAHGYAVTVTELVGWEHSLKNELIVAKRVKAEDKKAREKIEHLLTLIPVKPRMMNFYFDESNHCRQIS